MPGSFFLKKKNLCNTSIYTCSWLGSPQCWQFLHDIVQSKIPYSRYYNFYMSIYTNGRGRHYSGHCNFHGNEDEKALYNKIRKYTMLQGLCSPLIFLTTDSQIFTLELAGKKKRSGKKAAE